uniref:Cytochrome n=1 Tax=Lutzomyia longipalpis TaxID=7200 RepID=A0A1B0CSW2_LUTLO
MVVLEVISGLILCIGALIWWWQRSARLYWEKNGVSYIPGPPFIGALKDCLTFRKSFGELLLDIYNHEKFKDDPVIGVYFFHKPCLVIRHPELIKNILVKDFANFVDRPANSDPHEDIIGTDNLFAVKGLRWKTIRAKVSPVFTAGKLKNFFLLLVDITKILEQKLQKEIGDEPKEYEMKEFASFFTTDTIALYAFGVQANSLLNPRAEFHINVKRTFDFNWKRAFQFASCFFLPELATLFRFAFFSKETTEFLRSSINFVMEERIKSGTKQALRMYPPLPFLDRVCSPPDGGEYYSLEPYHSFAIPKGMPVYIPHIAIQRDEKFFPNPEEFIPERFSPENRDSINQYTYLAFGLGPRNCIGLRFGYLQAKLALITILNNYRVEATERTPKTIEFDKKALVLHSKEPLYMNLTRLSKMFALQVILGLILCIGALLWWWQRSARLYWEKNGVSYIPGPPFIGALKDCLTFRKSIGELFLDIYNHEKFKDDPVTGVYFFHEPILVIRHPELIKNILVKDFPNFMDRGVNGDTYHDLIATDNLFVVKGHRWQTIRNKLSPVFTTGKLKNLFLLMVNVTKILEQKLETEIGDQSKEYEMKEFASFFSTDTIALCAFGVQANSLLNPKADFHMSVKRIFNLNLKRIIVKAACFFFPKLATLFRFALFSKETNEFLRSSVNCVMEERIKKIGDQSKEYEMKEFASFFSTDTIALCAFGVQANSLLNPKADFHMSVKRIFNLNLKRIIVKTACFFFPKLATLFRFALFSKETNEFLRSSVNCVMEEQPYHKFAVPSGMSVYIPLLAIHRDPNYFPDPMKFIPERFDSTSWDLAHQNVFMAFGLGPRSCIGSRFGYLQVKLALITILRNYRVEASERTPKTIKLDKKAINPVIMSVLEVILGLIFCIGALIWWWQRSARLYWEKNGVSYIPGPPFIGALKDCLTMKKSFGELFLDFYTNKKFKDDPITGFYFFYKPSLVIRHPELIKNILVRDFTNFMDRGANSGTHDTIGRDSLFVVKGQRWKSIRQKISPVLTTGKLKNFFLLMVDVSKALDEKLLTEIKSESREYEVKELAAFFTIDAIAISAFGVKANSLLNPNGEFYKNAKKCFDFHWKRAIEAATCFFLPELAILFRMKMFSKETNEFLRSSINFVIQERIRSGIKRNDLIDVLITRLYWKKNGVSYIPGPPFIGALKGCFTFRQSFCELFLDIYNHEKFKDDPVTGVYFFHKPCLVVRHPELIKNILVKDFSNFVDRPANSDPHEDIIGRDNLFVVKGLRWKTIRAKVSPVFTVGKLKNFFLLMVDVTKILEQKLQTEIGNEPKEYEMKEFASLFTTDTIALCAFGVQANSLLNPKADFHVNVKKTFEVNWKRAFQLASCFFLPELATLLRFTFFSKETNEFIRSSINYVMEERIKKAVRLYPHLPFLDRVCSPPDGEENYSLEPYHSFAIPKGMTVYIPVIAIHRDENFFPNPEEFIPERFSRENRDSINQYSFLSFGIGPRNCIGSRFGYLQAKLTLITILNNYRVEATERTPKTIEFDRKALVLHSKEPLYMNLTRNLSSDPHDDVIGSNNILALKGQAWKNMRSKLSPIFTAGKLKNFFKLLLEVSDVLEQKLTSEITSQSREYEMKELASYFSTDTIAITAFGVKANSLLNPNAEFFNNAMRAVKFDWKRGFEFAICMILPEVGKRLGFTFFSKETNKFLRSSMNYVIEERIKSGGKRNDLIDILNDLKEKDPDFFTRDVIVAQAAVFLIAGAETSSSAISFTLYELSRHLEIQEKLRKEIKTYLEKHDGKVEYETINEMEYLTCVIQEALRLYPTAPFLDRTCVPVGKDSYSLEPYHSFSIPRGMPVAVPAIAVQRDPKFFPKPLEFIPERFSHENRDSINPVAFLPFGIGPRSCVGLRFGYLQVKLALITILRNYRVEATERTPKSIKFDKKSRSARLYWEKHGVSYVSGPPFIGILKDIILNRKGFPEIFMDIYNHEKFKDDPVTGIYIFHKPFLVVRHPELIKNIFVKDFPDFMDRNLSSDPHDDVIGSNNILALKGQEWKSMRSKLSPLFTTGKLKSFFTLLKDVADVLDQKLTLEITNGSLEYEIKDLCSYYAIDTIAITAFGVKANSLLNPNAEFYKNAMTAVNFDWRRGFEFTICMILPEVGKRLGFTFFSKETNKFLVSSMNYVIEERKKSGIKRNDLIDILSTLKEQGADFSTDTIVAQAAVFLIAGSETTSSAIAFTLYELALHPQIQEKLRKEIKTYLEKHDGKVDYETINEMEYLTCVIQETVRLYPTTPFIDRNCVPVGKDSYSLKPYHNFSIPRGMPIVVPSIAIHRDPKFFPNPLEFTPERFNSENRDAINQYAFLAFGIGPRNCIGSRFGYLQVKLALVTILSKYRIEATEKTPRVIKFDKKSMMLASEDPVYVKLTRL